MLACIRIWNFDYVGVQDALASVQTGAPMKAMSNGRLKKFDEN
jgi:hypothetical protein